MSGYAVGQPLTIGLPDQLVVRGTNPAAGASFLFNLDSRYVWSLIECVFTLTTDANVANRYVTVTYAEDGQENAAVSGAAVLFTANGTQRFVGSQTQTVAEWNTGTDVFFHLASVLMYGGANLAINVGAIQVGDTLTKIRLTFNRWLTDQTLADDSVT